MSGRLGLWAWLIVSAGLLAGCAGAAGAAVIGDGPASPTTMPVIEVTAEGVGDGAATGQVSDELPAPQEAPAVLPMPAGTITDGQGAVEVSVTPHAEQSARMGKLAFLVVLDTHSVDLSMDLSLLAELETDTGLKLAATGWSGGSGHHVTGLLEFELPQGEAASQLWDASWWRLTIRGVDAEERRFEWRLNGTP